MSNYLNNIKHLGVHTLVLLTLFGACIEFSSSWRSWAHFIETGTILAIFAGFLFSIQFNQTRYGYLLMALFTLPLLSEVAVYNTLNGWLPNDHQLTGNWPLNTALLVICSLAFMKERGVFSVHTLHRLMTFSLMGVLALANELLPGQLSAYSKPPVFFQLAEEMQTNVQIWLIPAFTCITLLVVSLKRGALIHSALLLTAVVLLLDKQKIIPLASDVVYFLLVTLLVVFMLAESYFLAYRDELTGLPSRRALTNLALSLGRKYTVAMLDVDHFKKFNDTYGHDIGDQVLKLVAAQMRKVSGGGKVFRYGGEEFTIVFPRKNAEQTLNQLEQLRERIANYKMVIRQPVRTTKASRNKQNKASQKTVSVTVSIGVSARQSKQSFDQVMKVADQALYRAKKKGRNNVSQ
ncbi:GGDEF domain-containing protein [Thalassotalea euphylliae]|uniref:GGDEF domain-containing protein n=1 Tax=Thalassotalea euphylliae TaxID=1655234 RepID=UPI003634129D